MEIKKSDLTESCLELIRLLSNGMVTYSFNGYDEDVVHITAHRYPTIKDVRAGDIWVYDRLDRDEPCFLLIFFDDKGFGDEHHISREFDLMHGGGFNNADKYEYDKSRYIGRLKDPVDMGRFNLYIKLVDFKVSVAKRLLRNDDFPESIDDYAVYMKEMLKPYCAFIV